MFAKNASLSISTIVMLYAVKNHILGEINENMRMVLQKESMYERGSRLCSRQIW